MVTSTSGTSSTSSQILSGLGLNSGIDYSALVDQLVTATFQTRNNQLASLNRTLTAEISSATTLKNNISSFASGLKTLATGGTLSTQVTSSDASIIKASALPGARPLGTASQLEVRQLAQAQSAASSVIPTRTTAIGTGTLSLQLGTATTDSNGVITGFTPGSASPTTITIDSNNNTLDGIAAAINTANAGVTASIITDSGGARLVLRGQTGEAQAFTLTAAEDVGAEGLAQLNVGVGSSVGIAAQDAVVAVDGIAVKRSTNSIDDLIDGAKLDLVSAKPGTTLTLSSTIPNDALKQSVNDFVAAYNNLLGAVNSDLDQANGALRGDGATRTFRTALSRLTLTQLTTPSDANAPRTLAEIGVSTNRDGSLSVDTTRLDAALAKFPEAVSALFADGTGATGNGLVGAFQAVADAATDSTTGLGGSIDRYTKQQSTIGIQQDKIDSDTASYRDRLTRQFSGVSAQVSAYQSIGSLLTQRFNNNSNNGN